MVTLEWLLIVSDIAGLAAVSVLAVQHVLDDSTELPPRPEVLIVDAEIAAAKAADAAGCKAIEDDFSDVVNSAAWDPSRPPGARCKLTRHGSSP